MASSTNTNWLVEATDDIFDTLTFLVILDPLASIALSVWVFEEYFTPNVPRLALAAISLASMCVAVTILTRTAPATMDTAGAPATAQ